jgi:hypothetical protein
LACSKAFYQAILQDYSQKLSAILLTTHSQEWTGIKRPLF